MDFDIIKSLHSGCFYYVDGGVIKAKGVEDFDIIEPAIIVDTDLGMVLKIGDKNKHRDILDIYFKGLSTIIGSCIKYIEFNKEDFSLDDSCTLINYMRNTIGKDLMNELLSLDPRKLKVKIFELQEMGF